VQFFIMFKFLFGLFVVYDGITLISQVLEIDTVLIFLIT
jgi:hypothetical protein